jgi:hypothetical protein
MFEKYGGVMSADFNKIAAKNDKLKQERIAQLKVDLKTATEKEKFIRKSYTIQDSMLKNLQSPGMNAENMFKIGSR